MKNIAIVCIAYNRLASIKRLLKSLDSAFYDGISTDLIISIDKSETDVVEKFADTYIWQYGNFRVIKHRENLGLRKHILSIGNLLQYEYESLIILEDDISVSPYFMRYARQCVEKYYDDDRIAGISLYNPPINTNTKLPFNPVQSEFDVYLMNWAMSWGQIWMRNQWDKFIKWYEKNDEDFNLKHLPENINKWGSQSWLKYHIRYCIEQGLFFVYPYTSLSTNNNEIGTHRKEKNTYFQSQIKCIPSKSWKLPNYDECPIKYDGFMEPTFLIDYLELPKDEVCIDLNCTKYGKIEKRYRLTRMPLPYKIIKSFSLEYKPLEANIILNNEGSDIFLYDTTTQSQKPNPLSNQVLFEYFYLNSLELLCNFSGMFFLIGKIVKSYTRRLYGIIRKLKLL